MQPLGNITLNHQYRLSLLTKGSLSVVLASKLVLKYLARRYYCRLHVFPPISHPTYVVTKQAYTAVLSVAFHPSLHFLTSGFDDRTVRLWNYSDLKILIK